MLKRYFIILSILFSACMLFFVVYILNSSNKIMQDINLNANTWTNIYEIDSSNIHKINIINDANNDDIINVSVLDKNKKVAQEAFSIQLGEKREVISLQNEYVIQAQAYKIDGNYRIRILK